MNLDHIVLDIRGAARRKLRGGTEEVHAVRLVHYAPGNGTKYRLIFTDLGQLPHEALKATGMPAYSDGVLVAWEQMGAMIVTRPGFVHWTYVAEKMKCNQADAEPLADIIQFITGGHPTSQQQYEEARR